MHDVKPHQIWNVDGHYARVGNVLGDQVEMHLRIPAGVSDVKTFSAKVMRTTPTRFKFVREGYERRPSPSLKP